MARLAPGDTRRQSGPFTDSIVIKLLLLQLASLCVTEVSCQTTTVALPSANTTSAPSGMTTAAHAMPSANNTTSAPSRNATAAHPTTSANTTSAPSRTTAAAHALPSANTTSAPSEMTTGALLQLTSTTPGFTLPVITKRSTAIPSTTDSKVVAMTTMTTAGSSTPAADVVVTSVRPVYGPVAGGTRVTITGQGLNASTIVAVHFGQHKTADFRVEGDSLIAMTPPVSDTAQNLAIAIEFFNQSTPLDTSFMFEYRPNPTVTTLEPHNHLIEGGTVVTVTGNNLDSVAAPRIIFTTVDTYYNGTNTTRTRKYYSEPCEFPANNGDSMTCVIPRFVDEEITRERSDGRWNSTDGEGVAAFVATDGSRRLDVYVGLQFDGYDQYENVNDEFPNMKFHFPPKPTVTCPSDVIEVDPDEEDTVISIEGEHLNRGSRQEDFRITIGDGECVVTELTEDRVDCKPPSMKPNKKDDDTDCDDETMTLEVMIGNVHYECSCVLYQDDDDVDLGMIIGVCIVVFIVTLFVIFLIFVLVECVFCGRRKAKSVEPDDQNL